MCGIAGFMGRAQEPKVLARMLEVLRHRGPDDDGVLEEKPASIGMRRLSIIDIAGGHQPMLSADGRYAIVFNGEIFNYRELRAELAAQGESFASSSDTEVILKLYAREGAGCLKHLRGMFTFAIIDCHEERVFIARDRLGVKPLYYWRNGSQLVFASEIKALLEHPEVPRAPRLAALDDYLALRFVPGPGTLFEGIAKFPAAHSLTWQRGAARWERYWDVPRPGGERLSDEDYCARFDELFDEAVRLRMIADVPLGCFLSGGLDSGAIAASMARQSSGPVKTFSVGFGWEGDELAQARQTAAELGCEHHEIVCRPESFADLPQLVWNLDEPIGDAIVMPMYMLGGLARRHVTVVLTGEGADETMAGYLMHRLLVAAQRYRRLAPATLRRLAPAAVRRVPLPVLDLLFDYPASLGRMGRERAADFLREIETGDLDSQYRLLISLFGEQDRAALLVDRRAPLSPQAPRAAPRAGLDEILRLQYAQWLPDDILCKADKTSMAHSIEARMPFMDHKLVEFLATVPAHLKLSGGRNKLILRRHLERRVPALAGRRKRAFYIPVERFLTQGVLAEVVAVCLSEAAVRRRGLFRWEQVKRLRESVAGGEFLHGKQLFSLLVLELWFRIFIDREAGWIAQPKAA
jgi:asparagine synthase (glutamine-hydrolysing)